MWFKLAGATFTNNLGTMDSISKSYMMDYSGLTGLQASPGSVSYATDSTPDATITFIVKSGYVFKSGSTVTASGGASKTYTASADIAAGSSFTMALTGINNKVTFTGAAELVSGGGNTGGGGEPTDPTPDAPTITGFTAQPLSLDTSNWVRSTVGASGSSSVSEGSSTTRLTYNQVFTAPLSGRIKVTCADNFQWGIRSGARETSMMNNQFWLNNGDELQLATSATKDCKFMLIFKKVNSAEPPFARKIDSSTVAITKDDITTMNPALYFADNYSVAFDVSDYKFMFTPDTDTSKWVLATVSESGIGDDGSRPDRLTYNVVLDGTQLQEAQVIGVTCAEGYQWAVRVSNNDGTSYPNNCYWYDSGTFIRVGYAGTSPSSTPSATNYILVFRKYKNVGEGTSTSNENDFTGKEEAAALNAKVYTAQGY